jgi:hypothetical protein
MRADARYSDHPTIRRRARRSALRKRIGDLRMSRMSGSSPSWNYRQSIT